MSALTLPGATLPATRPDTLLKLSALEGALLQVEQVPLRTEHMLHAGLYARTVRLPAGTVITGALIKRSTLLITHGACDVLVDDQWRPLRGYQVIAASAGRKQCFVSWEPVELTMIFPTAATTVEAAEQEFTDDAEILLSNRSDNGDLVTITGE